MNSGRARSQVPLMDAAASVASTAAEQGMTIGSLTEQTVNIYQLQNLAVLDVDHIMEAVKECSTPGIRKLQ